MINNQLIIALVIIMIFLVLIIKPYDTKVSNNNLNDTPCCKLRPSNQEQCYKSKHIPCNNINGNYKQCTNNFKHKIECQCDQNTLNLDTCSKTTNEKCFHKNDLPNKPVKTPSNCKPRVNFYNPNYTIHDILK